MPRDVKQPAAILEFRGRVTVDDYVADIAWSPDATRLAIAGGEGKVYLATRRDETLDARQIGTHGLGALAVAWRPRGEHFVSSGQDSRLVLYDDQGTKLLDRRPSMSWTQSLVWSPDGSQLASAAGKQVSHDVHSCH